MLVWNGKQLQLKTSSYGTDNFDYFTYVETLICLLATAQLTTIFCEGHFLDVAHCNATSRNGDLVRKNRDILEDNTSQAR